MTLASLHAESKKKLLAAKLDALLLAARIYAEQTSGGGDDPLMAGARLRIAAKEWATAQWETTQ